MLFDHLAHAYRCTQFYQNAPAEIRTHAETSLTAAQKGAPRSDDALGRPNDAESEPRPKTYLARKETRGKVCIKLFRAFPF